MITEHEALASWRKRADKQPLGRTVLDLEADSLHRHREKLCLIQYADAEGVAIIDPLSIEDMRLFTDWLREADVWMHGADYDMSLFQNAYGVLPHMILDTQIAARLLGFRQFGLAALVEHFYDVKLSKKNQKADWGKRPIPAAMQEYAQGDVKYMLEMADMLVAELRAQGRYDWFRESCVVNLERGRQRHEAGSLDPWRIKGCGKLNRRGLAALRALWNWRDREASEWDKPSFMVCGNEDLLRWSLALQEFRTVNPHSRFHAHRAARFRKAVEHFQVLDEEDYPQKPRHERQEISPEFDTLLEHWTERRNEIAEALGLETCLIASRQQLEAIASDEASGLGQLMSWQRELLLR